MNLAPGGRSHQTANRRFVICSTRRRQRQSSIFAELGCRATGLYRVRCGRNDYFGRLTAGIRNKRRLPETTFFASARFIEKKNLSTLIEAYAEYPKVVRLCQGYGGQGDRGDVPVDLVSW